MEDADAEGRPEPHHVRVWPNFLQKTSIPELLEQFDSEVTIQSAPPAWSVPGASGAAAAGADIDTSASADTRVTPMAEPGARMADPASLGQWAHRRSEAPVAKVSTERFDPGAPFSTSGIADLDWRETQIRANVQRIQAVNGQWVRNHVVVRPVRPLFGVSADDVAKLETSLNRALNGYVNRGYELPVSGERPSRS